jgi:PhoPQ-activated pathogenicity-related protein
LDVYTPSEVRHDKAFLYVTGGQNTGKDGKAAETFANENIDFAGIAEANGVVVVVLYNVPNQYLFFDGQPLKEDPLLAYTYKKVMADPHANAYLAGHLPMAKAITKAMDAVQAITESKGRVINRFILSGASKRGWAAWLAALEDKRVSELIPVVIDINIQHVMNHTCDVYKGGCPDIYHRYYGDEIIKRLNSSSFRDLMTIEDPFSYWSDNAYKQRFDIPMYFIQASGDDFFPPDSMQFYFKTLQARGNKLVRYLPNAPHYINFKDLLPFNSGVLGEAIASYVHLILAQAQLPEVSWTFGPNVIDVNSSLKPISVTLFTSVNEEDRDFRCFKSYSKWRFMLKKVLSYLPFVEKNSCDQKYVAKDVSFACDDGAPCSIHIDVPRHSQGWQASFAELHYQLRGYDFVVTTEVLVS